MKGRSVKSRRAHGVRRKLGVAVLPPDKEDYTIKNLINDKDGHFIMIKGTIHLKGIKLIDIYVLNLGASKYIKQLLTKLKTETGEKKHSHSRGPN